jgi:hypothetical protein
MFYHLKVLTDVVVEMDKNNMDGKDEDKKGSDEKNVDEKLIKWNDIFKELTVDAQTFIKDLLDSISYIAISALIVLLLGGAALSIAIIQAKGIQYIAAGVIIFSVCAANASRVLLKWYRLRNKYKHLLSLQKEII